MARSTRVNSDGFGLSPRLTAAMATFLFALVGSSLAFTGSLQAQDSSPISRPVPPSFADLVESKLPAVVNISSRQSVPADRIPQRPQIPPELEEFFGEFFGGLQPQRPREMTALGSGFIISPEGYVVTNNHVVENATEITVVLQDDREFEAKLVGRDPPTDLALLKIEPGESIPYAEWGNSTRLRPGDWVLAIGNPFGLGGTVTAGIISARARDIQSGPYDDFLQTDASINRGNSGGPLFATDGRVVGVNTAIFSPTGTNIGIGFAVPSSVAEPIIAQLRQDGEIRRGWLGVQLQEITPQLAEALDLPDRNGALVADVMPRSPAARAGLRSGDVVVAFEGQKVDRARDLARAVGQSGPGRKAELTILRDGQRVTESVELGRMRQRQASVLDQPSGGTSGDRLGLQLAPLTPELRSRFGIPRDRSGTIIVGVAPGSSAAEQGLRPGDIIVRAGDKPVDAPEDVVDAVDNARQKGQKAVVVLVQRAEGSLFVPIPLTG